jgi:pyridoxal phosphate enzyme (YggS family)
MNRIEELRNNLEEVKSRIPNPEVTLIVVTKTYPVSDVKILRDLGVENFGENRNEEGLLKSADVPARWHYQGEIQSRKLRDIAGWADVIHSLDSQRHIEKLSAVANKTIEVFLQLSLDGDPARGGAVESELSSLADSIQSLPNLQLTGLMCVPPLHSDPRIAFSEIAQIHRRFTEKYPSAPYLSAGMSGDFEVAIEYGATHIRVGSSILGSRTGR